MSKYFYGLLVVIVFISLALHLFVAKGNNFFFTVDQGRDALYVREILTRGQVFLKGPETNIRGLFAGPLVDYFISVGYLVTSGNPFGAVVAMIAANLFITVLLLLWLRKKVGDIPALAIVFSLQFFWGFFETALWGFHPFPLAALSFLLIFLLLRFLDNRPKYYYAALVVSLLAFNAEVAGALAMFLFFVLVGLYGVKKKIITSRKWLIIAVSLPVIGGVFFGRQFLLQLGTGSSTVGGSAGRVFAGTSFSAIFQEFTSIIGSVVLPQNMVFGIVGFCLLLIYFFKNKHSFNKHVMGFIVLTLGLTLVSFVFFGSNQGYRSWHTVYLPPLLFVSAFLIILKLPRRISFLVFTAVMVFQISNFKNKYEENLKQSENPSILYNQLAVVDWIYESSDSQGFRVYNYTDTFYDYPYQYLFWWHGLSKYGYLPDEYSNFPLSQKPPYVPGDSYYAEPKRSGEDLKYLIIESDTNGEENKDWISKFRQFHNLVDTKMVGDIKVEKYLKKHDAPNDLCIWWGRC